MIHFASGLRGRRHLPDLAHQVISSFCSFCVKSASYPPARVRDFASTMASFSAVVMSGLLEQKGATKCSEQESNEENFCHSVLCIIVDRKNESAIIAAGEVTRKSGGQLEATSITTILNANIAARCTSQSPLRVDFHPQGALSGANTCMVGFYKLDDWVFLFFPKRCVPVADAVMCLSKRCYLRVGVVLTKINYDTTVVANGTFDVSNSEQAGRYPRVRIISVDVVTCKLLEARTMGHSDVGECPMVTPTMHRPLCNCRCGCRRRPNRRVLCVRCGAQVGPGCCLALESATRRNRGLCHVCRDGDPEQIPLLGHHFLTLVVYADKPL